MAYINGQETLFAAAVNITGGGSKLYRHNIHITDTWGLDLYFEVINRDPTDYTQDITFIEEEDATDFRDEYLAFLTHPVSAFGEYHGGMIDSHEGAVTGLRVVVGGLRIWGEFVDIIGDPPIYTLDIETRFVDTLDDTVEEV